MKQGVRAQTGIIRFGIKLCAVPCKHVNESSSSTHCWRFLDQPIRHHFGKGASCIKFAVILFPRLPRNSYILFRTRSKLTARLTTPFNDYCWRPFPWLLYHSRTSLSVLTYGHVQKRKGNLLLSASSTATCSTQLDQNTVTLTTDFHPSNNAHPLISLQSSPGH